MAERFELSDKKGYLEGTRIITDTQTGVQYLFVNWGSAGGLTVLVERDGKPLVDENYLSDEPVDLRQSNTEYHN